MIRIKDMSRSPDTTVHHQCSIFANRNRNVHKFKDSVIDAMAVTRPWKSAVITARPIDDQRKPVPAELLRRNKAELGGCGAAAARGDISRACGIGIACI
jgi:hypothetical protein